MNKKIIILIISILVLGGVSIFFIWNNIEQNSDPHIAILNEKYSDEQMEKFILSYVNDYKIENKGDTIQVTFNAPDFASFIKNLSEDSTMDKLDLNNSSNEESTKFVIKELKKMIVNKKINMKDYILTVENTNQETIEKAFMDKISDDIFLNIFKNLNLDNLKEVMKNDVWENLNEKNNKTDNVNIN